MIWSMRQVLFCLVGSTSCTLFVFLLSFFFWTRWQKQKFSDPQFYISAIIQTGPEKEALQTQYLAELLDLSVDRPLNLYAYDLKKGEQKLLASPLISDARLKRMPPNALYVDYEVRKPVARLGDYQNIAIDQDGYLFPLSPFFAPKELPEIYLGLPSFGSPEDSFGRCGGLWQTTMKNSYLDLAFDILKILEGSPWRDGLRIQRIDVSNAFAPSLGQREIVLFTEEDLFVSRDGEMICCVFPKMLRLSSKDYLQQMNNFLRLRKSMMEDYTRQIAVSTIPQSGRFSSRIIDLRIPHLAFVENETKSNK
jgi:hypothetical protein